ncbi:MAG: hypothetical protein EA338_09295 [Roseinatronobacter sp.]|nr:MAG: hypothetical protein EA338_09295 [Roseinatronobacter sp.]
MTRIGKTDPPLWMLLGLWVSTSKWRAPDWLPEQDRAILTDAMQGGWAFRCVSPRWDAIWQPYMGDLARIRVILLPGWGFGLSRDEAVAMSRARMAGAGLQPLEPDLLALRSAECKRQQAISPVWSGALSCNDNKKGRR